jgi:hypothetical protein
LEGFNIGHNRYPSQERLDAFISISPQEGNTWLQLLTIGIATTEYLRLGTPSLQLLFEGR